MSSHPLLSTAKSLSSAVCSNSSGHDDALALGDADTGDALLVALAELVGVVDAVSETLPLLLSDVDPVGDHDRDGVSDHVPLPLSLTLPLGVPLPVPDTLTLGDALSDTLPLPLSLTLPLRDADGDADSLTLPLALLLSLRDPLSLTLPLLVGDHDTLLVADGVDDTHAPAPVCTRTHSTPTAPVSTLPLTLLTKLTLTDAPLCTTSTSTLCTVSDP